MSMRIITGSTGTTHVTSNDDGCYNQALWGKESIIFGVGEKLKATIIDNNTIEIADGDILLQGRHARINPNTTENVLINTGAVGVNRNDLIVARYTLDDSTGYEDISLVVIEGTESSGAAVDPEYTEGDIRTGAALVDFPLYRVKIEGINITDVELLAQVATGGIGGLKEEVDTINQNLSKVLEWKLLGSGSGTTGNIVLSNFRNTKYKEFKIIMVDNAGYYQGVGIYSKEDIQVTPFTVIINMRDNQSYVKLIGDDLYALSNGSDISNTLVYAR